MVSIGKFVLHGSAVPPLPAGQYTLTGKQTISADEDRSTATHTAHINVTAPRFRMPPDQILSVFPPANSEGAYEERLPQIVMKRRTLPWERVADPANRDVPWLALVVIAEGEGEISAEVPVAQCVTLGVTQIGPNDVASGIYLAVPQRTINKVFPCKEDLPLLAHVREVNLEDTELAMGDDDGFIAVVMANRLPQFDRVNCKPVRYVACLINLEGQLQNLPKKPEPVLQFAALAEVFDIRSYYYDASNTGGGSPDITVMTATRRVSNMPMAVVAASPESAMSKMPSLDQVKMASPSRGASSDWAATGKTIEQVALTTASANVASAVRDAMKSGFRIPIEGIVIEPVYRFPILAHWSFTCDGGGSFRSLMEAIDVGLLGTLPAEAAVKKRPDCAPSPAGTAPPPTPQPRLAPEIAETGHVGLLHVTRAGDQVRAWYRGPFVPSPTIREVSTAAPSPVLAHTSDQLRAVVPDGREDLSLAVAFEIGRLLSLSRPAFVSALIQWRREQFGAERARRLARLAVQSVDSLKAVLKSAAVASLGPLIGRSFVLATSAKADSVYGPFRVSNDPGRPIDYLPDNVAGLLATGLAIDPSVLNDLQKSGSAQALASLSVPVGGKPGDVSNGAHLKAQLGAAVQRLASDVSVKKIPGRAVRKGGAPIDALDGMIAARERVNSGETR